MNKSSINGIRLIENNRNFTRYYFSCLKQLLTYRILSLFLAIQVLFAGTAKEFIHQFADHKDTVHCNNRHGSELSFESKHHHCSFLDDSLAPFYTDAQFPHIEILTKTYQKSAAHILSVLLTKERFFTTLRGPPSLV